MSEKSIHKSAPNRRRAMLLRGESIIAGLGAATAAIVFTVAISGAWFTLRTAENSNTDYRRAHLQSINDILAPSAEAMIAADDWSAFRRLMIDVGRTQNLSVCQLVIPIRDGDGKVAIAVAADEDPTRITLATLGKSWRSGPI
ncbi:MAG: hypothetical protein JO353_08375, partial [Phycisphaerae bacterium]|nr:hypothetical protein [Phycisphaerae bacterium]